MAANIHESGHPLIMHKITQMRKAAARPKYLHTLIKEVSTFLCYEATKDLPLEACDVQTLCGAERGLRIAQRVGVVPVLRGGLGMVEAMTEFCSNAQVWHLGIYRDKKSLLPVEYYNKLPKRITVQTVFVLDPMPMSGATAKRCSRTTLRPSRSSARSATSRPLVPRLLVNCPFSVARRTKASTESSLGACQGESLRGL